MNLKITAPIITVITLFLGGCNQISTTPTLLNNKAQKTITGEIKMDGDSKLFLGENLSSWAIVSSNGTMRLAGITMPLSVNKESISKNVSDVVHLGLPEEFKRMNFVDHIDVQFRSTGFTNDLQEPSFSLRFYGISEAEQKSIDCDNDRGARSENIPDGYARISSCEPFIGTRYGAINNADDLDHPTSFARVNFGYTKGALIFFEIVVTADKLLKNESFTLNIPMPNITGQDTFFPDSFSGVYIPSSNSYDFSIWNFINLHSLFSI